MSRFETEDGFNIQFYSGCEYERLVAEIYYDGKLVVTIVQEVKPGVFEVVFPVDSAEQSIFAKKVAFEGFCETLRAAKDELAARS
jgi:hypothetical protein